MHMHTQTHAQTGMGTDTRIHTGTFTDTYAHRDTCAHTGTHRDTICSERTIRVCEDPSVLPVGRTYQIVCQNSEGQSFANTSLLGANVVGGHFRSD